MVTSGRSPRAEEIVAAAREILEREGAEALTMRRVAAALGIRAPSLYKHLPDKEALETALIAAGLEESADRFEAAVDGAERPLTALAGAYRAFAGEHPHLYRLMTQQPLPRDRLPVEVEERAARPVVDACGGDTDTARAVWSFAHGMAVLELNGRFPPNADLDAAWRRGVEAFTPPAGSCRGSGSRSGRMRA